MWNLKKNLCRHCYLHSRNREIDRKQTYDYQREEGRSGMNWEIGTDIICIHIHTHTHYIYNRM